MDAEDQLRRGRDHYARRSWAEAYGLLAAADEDAPLSAEDLERLADAAYMLARHAEHESARERLQRAQEEGGDTRAAARTAFWLGMHLVLAGEIGRATGWLARAGRLIEREEGDFAERGYLLLPLVFQRQAAGDYEEAVELAGRAAAYGERHGDPELFALAVHAQGHLLVMLERFEEGLRLLDEAMLSVTTGELSPIVSGIVYCGVILGCQDAYELGRAREWTEALSRWCEGQTDLVAFSGRCLVHRAELLQLRGDLPSALEEARAAVGRCEQARNRRAAGEAAYLQGEILRLQGRPDEAEDAYREAGRRGREPQPGLALLRLGQGDAETAVSAIRRALAETRERRARPRLLPAAVEILLTAGRLEDARVAADELALIASGHETGMLGALAAHARGAVALAGGDPEEALVALRRACGTWEDLGAPLESARTRMLLAAACRSLGDADAAEREIDAARAALGELGGGVDPAAIAPPAPAGAAAGVDHGLSARELEVLRLVASGLTNRAIAARLVLSDRTVDRHVSNIFAKLRVGSRTAATAYAYEHRIVGADG